MSKKVRIVISIEVPDDAEVAVTSAAVEADQEPENEPETAERTPQERLELMFGPVGGKYQLL